MSSIVEQTPSVRAERLADAPPAVLVEHLSKTFRLPHQRYNTLKERALHPLSLRSTEKLHAVRDVSVTIPQGEFFGIVGRNGSGKSTLLKCLAGIYRADSGHAIVRGRLSPFIELGVGFNPELTARDNVIINAIMLGLTRRQARERFDDIIAFAELEEFLDLKLKNYSSGMSVRLAFSTAIQVDADVLLVDEVLAVGDAGFQRKCFEEFHRLKAEGKTIVFVTHDMNAVERFCDRAMLIEHGRIVSIDAPDVIARAYNQLNFGRIAAPGEAPAPSGVGRVLDAWFEDAAGERVSELGQDEALTMCADVEFHGDADDPHFSFHLRNEARHVVFATGSGVKLDHSGRYAAGDRVRFRATLQNWFAPGHYALSVTVATPAREVLDVREDIAAIVVRGSRHFGGVMEIPHGFEVVR